MTTTPEDIAASPLAEPHIVLDGDMPRCSECDSTALTATAATKQSFTVANRATLRFGSHRRPVLWLVPAEAPSGTPVVRCEECGNTLTTAGLFDVQVAR